MKETRKKPIKRIRVSVEEDAYLSVTVSKSEGEREILLLAVEFLIAMALFIILIIPVLLLASVVERVIRLR